MYILSFKSAAQPVIGMAINKYELGGETAAQL